MSSSAGEQRAFELTAQIKSCAQSKQLDSALAAFDRFRAEGLTDPEDSEPPEDS